VRYSRGQPKSDLGNQDTVDSEKYGKAADERANEDERTGKTANGLS
jgi:hypothetical protein